MATDQKRERVRIDFKLSPELNDHLEQTAQILAVPKSQVMTAALLKFSLEVQGLSRTLKDQPKVVSSLAREILEVIQELKKAAE